jgi:hypothetical protein
MPTLMVLGNQGDILGDQLIALQHRARQDGQPVGDFLLLGSDLRKAVGGTRKQFIFHGKSFYARAGSGIFGWTPRKGGAFQWVQVPATQFMVDNTKFGE